MGCPSRHRRSAASIRAMASSVMSIAVEATGSRVDLSRIATAPCSPIRSRQHRHGRLEEALAGRRRARAVRSRALASCAARMRSTLASKASASARTLRPAGCAPVGQGLLFGFRSASIRRFSASSALVSASISACSRWPKADCGEEPVLVQRQHRAPATCASCCAAACARPQRTAPAAPAPAAPGCASARTHQNFVEMVRSKFCSSS